MQPSYLRGFRDIYAGVVPSVPGLYVLNDVYHYAGNANALVFNGAVQLGVEAKFTADLSSHHLCHEIEDPRWHLCLRRGPGGDVNGY